MKSKIAHRIWALILLSPLLYCPASIAQTQPFIHFSIPEGLPSSETYDVHQDRKGFIWFATDNGVVRYDGNQMEILRAAEGLTDPVVFGITEDSKGRIWFRTFSGKICYYSNNKIHAYQFNDSLSQFCKNTILVSLYIDSLDNVWFSSVRELGKIDSRGGIEKQKAAVNELGLKKIEGTYITGYLCSIDSIQKIKVNEIRSDLKLNKKGHIRQICMVTWRGQEYFSIGTTVFKIGKKNIEPVLNTKDQIISLYADRDDNLWIGYLQNGVERYSSVNDKAPFSIPILGSKSVTSIIQDTQKGHWFSTLEDGIYYLPQFISSNREYSDHSKIRTVFARDGKTFIGDDLGQVSVLDAQGKLVLQKKFKDQSIICIFSDSQKNNWVSTVAGTYFLDDHLNIKKIVPISFGGATEDTEGGFIWGVSGYKLIKCTRNGDIIALSQRRVARSISLVNDYFYLFGRLGLEVFDRSLKEVKIPNSFANLKISKVIALNKDFILITTLGNGFYVVNKNDWNCQHYDAKKNFIANNVYAAVIVDSTLWLGTEKGIAVTRVRPLVLNAPSFQFFNKRNGLSNDRITRLSYSKPNVWAFDDDGFSLLPSHLANKKQNDPTFYLKKLLINNEVDSLETLNHLSFDKNNVQIDFGFIDFRYQNIFVRYRLSSTGNWNYTTERSIEFFSLSPGDYSFELEYSTDNFHWISALQHPVNISPQWLMNWKIQLSIILGLSLFGFLYYRRRIHLLREKQKLLGIINEQQQKLIRAELETLESERSRIAKDLHDSVGTNLAAIKLFLSSFFKKSNEPNASIIEETLQETIQGTRDIITNLSPAHLELFGLVEAIKIYIQRIKDQFDIDIELTALGNEVNHSQISIHLFRIIQELITNSLKYAKANKITINVTYTSNLVVIRYQDDGVGFKVNSISKGNGLLNIQSRIQILEGQIKFESNGKGVSYHIEVALKVHQS